MERDPRPNAGITGGQSARTTRVGGGRGYDGGKKVKGRKRHLLINTHELVLTVLAHAADVYGRDGGILRKLYRQPADKAGRQAHTPL